jgi:hypothetical protein
MMRCFFLLIVTVIAALSLSGCGGRHTVKETSLQPIPLQIPEDEVAILIKFSIPPNCQHTLYLIQSDFRDNVIGQLNYTVHNGYNLLFLKSGQYKLNNILSTVTTGESTTSYYSKAMSSYAIGRKFKVNCQVDRIIYLGDLSFAYGKFAVINNIVEAETYLHKRYLIENGYEVLTRIVQ